MTALIPGLWSGPLQVAPGKPLSGLSSKVALAILRDLYGDEWAPILLAVAVVESNIDPDAIGDRGISRGAFQVNVETWGEERAPMPPRDRSTVESRFRAQAVAIADIVADAQRGAAELAAVAAAPAPEAVNLVWQFGRRRAREIVAGSYWSVEAVARGISRLYGESRAAAWRVRQQAFAAAYAAAIAALRGMLGPAVVGASAGAMLFLLILLWLLFRGRR